MGGCEFKFRGSSDDSCIIEKNIYRNDTNKF